MSNAVRRSWPLVAVAVATGFVVAVLAAVALLPAPTDEPGPPRGAVLDGPARRALDAVPVRRGSGPPRADPAVDVDNPEAVARAYLVAARSVVAADGGHTHLRAAAYAAPGSPPAAVGVVVLDPPPLGQRRTAAVAGLELVAANRSDLRRGYLARLTTTTGPPGGTATRTEVMAYVVLARQPDGRWLVAADTSEPPDGGHD